jgi:hypothetical protein
VGNEEGESMDTKKVYDVEIEADSDEVEVGVGYIAAVDEAAAVRGVAAMLVANGWRGLPADPSSIEEALDDGRRITVVDVAARVRTDMEALARWGSAGDVVEADTHGRLTWLALNAASADVRKAVVPMITDQQMLTTIALKDSSVDVRGWAMVRLKDKRVARDIALDAGEPLKVREMAVICVGTVGADHTLLGEVAIGASEGVVRAWAALRLADDAILSRLVRDDNDDVVRAAATRNLRDREILVEVLRRDPVERVRAAAMDRIAQLDAVTTSQARLAESVARLAALDADSPIVKVCRTALERAPAVAAESAVAASVDGTTTAAADGDSESDAGPAPGM